MKNKNLILVVTAMATTSFSAMPVYADAISPQIKDTGEVYSKEKPNVEYYGTGIGGRAMEAMTLRFEVERMLQDGEYEKAVPKAKKAVQLDPGDPTAHLLLARALTRVFYSKQGPIDEKLLGQCLAEWNLLWHHSSDQFEQVEAKNEARRMMKIARVLAKKKKMEFEARLAAREELRRQRELEEKEAAKAAARPLPENAKMTADGGGEEDEDAEMDVTASLEAEYGTAETKAPEPQRAKQQPQAVQPVTNKPTIAQKKKRFGLF